jgi:hypothetical protein
LNASTSASALSGVHGIARHFEAAVNDGPDMALLFDPDGHSAYSRFTFEISISTQPCEGAKRLFSPRRIHNAELIQHHRKKHSRIGVEKLQSPRHLQDKRADHLTEQQRDPRPDIGRLASLQPAERLCDTLKHLRQGAVKCVQRFADTLSLDTAKGIETKIHFKTVLGSSRETLHTRSHLRFRSCADCTAAATCVSSADSECCNRSA